MVAYLANYVRWFGETWDPSSVACHFSARIGGAPVVSVDSVN